MKNKNIINIILTVLLSLVFIFILIFVVGNIEYFGPILINFAKYTILFVLILLIILIIIIIRFILPVIMTLMIFPEDAEKMINVIKKIINYFKNKKTH